MTTIAKQTMQTSSRWLQLARSEKLAVLLDPDGTLIDIAPTPELAVLDHAAIDLVEQLVAVDIDVCIVSGRPSPSIDEMRRAIPGASWIAEHGGWCWEESLVARPPEDSKELESLLRTVETLAIPGVLVERKSLARGWRIGLGSGACPS